ncbi:hypothetical protein SAMN06296056_102528 [Priestia filamentosa]|nr:hypothetical protein SAMN06296056_102528 [Priestia filamentosa]
MGKRLKVSFSLYVNGEVLFMYTWFYDHFVNTVIFPLSCLVLVTIILSMYAYFKLKKINK